MCSAVAFAARWDRHWVENTMESDGKSTLKRSGRVEISASAWPEIATFATRVTEARKARGWSQDALAAETGLTQSYISAVEQRMTNPSFQVMIQIARGLGVKLSSLIE